MTTEPTAAQPVEVVSVPSQHEVRPVEQAPAENEEATNVAPAPSQGPAEAPAEDNTETK